MEILIKHNYWYFYLFHYFFRNILLNRYEFGLSAYDLIRLVGQLLLNQKLIFKNL